MVDDPVTIDNHGGLWCCLHDGIILFKDARRRVVEEFADWYENRTIREFETRYEYSHLIDQHVLKDGTGVHIPIVKRPDPIPDAYGDW